MVGSPALSRHTSTVLPSPQPRRSTAAIETVVDRPGQRRGASELAINVMVARYYLREVPLTLQECTIIRGSRRVRGCDRRDGENGCSGVGDFGCILYGGCSCYRRSCCEVVSCMWLYVVCCFCVVLALLFPHSQLMTLDLCCCCCCCCQLRDHIIVCGSLMNLYYFVQPLRSVEFNVFRAFAPHAAVVPSLQMFSPFCV